MSRGWRVAQYAITLAAAAVAVAPPVAAQPAEGAAAAPSEIKVEPFRQRVDEAVGSDQAGARKQMKGRQVQVATLRALVDGALDKNFSVLIAAKDAATAEAAVDQADAAFDPVLNLNYTYNRTASYVRSQYITRPRAQQPPAENQNPATVIPCVTIDGSTYNPPPDQSGAQQSGCYNAVAVTRALEYASGTPLKQPYSWTASLTASKTFDWGQSVSAQVGSSFIRQNYYAVDGLNSFMSVSDPFGWGGRMPWVSNASLSLSTPVPYGKGFGPDGSASNLNLILAQSAQRKAALSLTLTRITALRQVITGYWNLVGAAEGLQVLAAHRLTLEDRAARTQRRFDAQLATTYDLAQVQAAVENVKSQEEASWNAYLSNSNTMLSLLGSDSPVVLVPSGYDRLLSAASRVDAGGDPFALAMDNSPVIKSRQEDIETARASLRYRDNQTGPDLTLNASFTLGQSSSTFGFQSWGDSITHLTQPDNRNIYVGLSFRYPLWQQAEESALGQARLNEKIADDNAASIRTQVNGQVENALRSVDSAKLVIRKTDEDLKLARLAYDKSLVLQGQDLVSEFEILKNYDDLLTAQLANVQAKASLRIAEAQLLAAEGVIEERLASILTGEVAQ